MKSTKRKTQKKTNAVNTRIFRQRVYNIVPDPIDPRDYSARSFGIFGRPTLPKRVDYSRQTLPVGDQGRTGSCVGWATSYLRAWLQRQSTGKSVRYSARFIWIAAKEIDPWPLNVMFDGAGTKIRDAFKIMKTHGAARDRLWPFSRTLPDSRNEQSIRQDALRHRIGSYYSLDNKNTDELRQTLAKVGPFVVGVPVFSNWNRIGSDGVIPDPRGAQVGGHAILVVGYDDAKKRFKIQNSWRRSWGDRGYGYISYSWMENFAWSSWAAARL